MALLDQMLNHDDAAFFRDLARDTTRSCCYSAASDAQKKQTPNHLGFEPVRPGGGKAYPAIWTQDFTMIHAAGFIPHQTGCDHLRLILATQNGSTERPLQNNAAVPPWAIADHINFDGTPVFFPGTYSSGDDQGGERYGLRPPYNNHYDAIWLAWLLCRQAESAQDILLEEIDGVTAYDRLKNAFDVPPVDNDGIVFTEAESRAVGFIFCDTIYMTGRLLMATLLRRRAAQNLADLATTLGRENDAERFSAEADKPLDTLAQAFAHPSGWLRASTGTSSQPDVFGSLYALYSGALSGNAQQQAFDAVIRGLEGGTIEQDGAVRHVPLDFNFSPDTTWEKTHTSNNTYQNGAYWHMPAGWLVATLAPQRPELAASFLQRYIDHMKREDFRRGTDGQAPWEWIIGTERSTAVPTFGPSVTLPYAILSGRI